VIRFPRKDADVSALAQELVNHPAQVMVARLCARDLGLPDGEPFNKLRVWLARAYAHGYVMGAEGIPHRDAMPPTPDLLGPQS
jgi:hypothetical protein